MIQKSLLALALCASFSFSAQAESVRNPVGEVANYKLDNNGRRTTSMIRRGKFQAKVLKHMPDSDKGPAYKTQLKFDLTIDWVGRKTGVQAVDVPEQYFQPEFMDELRRRKKMSFPQFKVSHKGMASVRNMDGKRYSNCDKVLIYDVDTSRSYASSPMMDILEQSILQVTQVTGAYREEIKNLRILAHVKEGVPVLGAVKVDIAGTARGFDFKAGFDYLAR